MASYLMPAFLQQVQQQQQQQQQHRYHNRTLTGNMSITVTIGRVESRDASLARIASMVPSLNDSNSCRSKHPRTRSSRQSTMMSILVMACVTIVMARQSTTCVDAFSTVHHWNGKSDRTRLRVLFTESQRHSIKHSFSFPSSLITTKTTSSRSRLTSLQSSSMLQETTVSLEWTEFFTPKTTTTTSPTIETDQQHTPVLLLHGLLGSKRNFSSLGRMLGVQLDKPRRVLGVDLRNHGDSQHAPNMSYRDMALDVIDFMDAQNLDKVVLVGHSMGGKVAQALALLYPERVDGLVVLDIAPVTYSRDQDPHWKAVEDILHAIYDVVVKSDATTATEIDKALQSSIPDPALRAFVLTNYDTRRQQWKIPIATLVHQLEQIAGFDDSLDGVTFDGDVFIIHGGQSRFVRHAYMDAISSYFPNHMLTTVRGAGHWVHAEAPDDVTALLKRYLDR
ncbi:alpha/beta fold family hydrolase [Nitzschia inconspicua]|uniref:Alpha/beta fold family hydrolase n=1 Tax=Nitzschia inconspicua TaxID=303405 RepID=A0A9K3LRH3_9STRA|nr:alpha/beta fold family hydrolase [Nitzschia inconspicua]